jgi:hypothetical protein
LRCRRPGRGRFAPLPPSRRPSWSARQPA